MQPFSFCDVLTTDLLTHTHTHTHTHQEAALYVHEGEDNNKFYHHPAGKWSKLAYNILHHPAFYISDLITSILLMLLAFIERPSLATEFQMFDRPQMRIMVVVRHSVARVLPSSIPPFFHPSLLSSFPPSFPLSFPPSLLPSLPSSYSPPSFTFLPPTYYNACSSTSTSPMFCWPCLNVAVIHL